MVQMFRELGDAKLVVPYLHIVWSGWRQLRGYSIVEARCFIREELGEIGAAGHRTDLVR